MKKTARQRLEEDVFGKGWYRLLKPFLEGEHFKNLANKLKALAEQGKSLTPNFSDMFRAFKECPLEKTHTVILGMDPYPGMIDAAKGITIADGIAFSSRDSVVCPKSLLYIYEHIDVDIYGGQNYSITDTFDLAKWSRQGILLLNCALSTEIGKSGVHYEIWRSFVLFVLYKLVKENPNINAILLGRQASYFKSMFPAPASVFTCEHPAAAAHTNRIWHHRNVFKNLDEHLKKSFNIKINW